MDRILNYILVYGSEFPTGGTGGQQQSQIYMKVHPSDLIRIYQGRVLSDTFINF